MDRVDSGDQPVQAIEQLGASLWQSELRAGYEVLVNVFLVFESLHYQERNAEQRRRQKAAENQAMKPLVLRRGLRSHHHRQAAAEKDGGIGCAIPDVGLSAGCRKSRAILYAADSIGQHQSTK